MLVQQMSWNLPYECQCGNTQAINRLWLRHNSTNINTWNNSQKLTVLAMHLPATLLTTNYLSGISRTDNYKISGPQWWRCKHKLYVKYTYQHYWSFPETRAVLVVQCEVVKLIQTSRHQPHSYCSMQNNYTVYKASKVQQNELAHPYPWPPSPKDDPRAHQHCCRQMSSDINK